MFIKYFWFLRAVIYSLFFKKIGFYSYMGPPIFLSGIKRISIGKRVRIFPGSRMEAGKKGNINIGENCSIGQNFHIVSECNVSIGDGVLVAENVFISDVDHIYDDVSKPVHEQDLLVKSTEIGSNCFLGFGSVILAGTKLGSHCIVGANSVVRGDFSDYSVIVGSPAKVIKQYDHSSKKWLRSIN